MTTRLKSGRFVGAATSESARRQLMQPVSCWEKAWVNPSAEQAAPGSNLKIYKWVKTDKKQQFSDDEEAADEPLAPLPDEPIQDDEDDEDKDQEDAGSRTADVVDVTVPPSRDVSEPVTALQSIAPSESGVDSVPPSKPHPLSSSYIPGPDTQSIMDTDETESTNIINQGENIDVNLSLNVNVDVDANLNLNHIDVNANANANENENDNEHENETEKDNVKFDNEDENDNVGGDGHGGLDPYPPLNHDSLDTAMESIDMRQFEHFDAATAVDEAMQDALENGMPDLLGS